MSLKYKSSLTADVAAADECEIQTSLLMLAHVKLIIHLLDLGFKISS